MISAGKLKRPIMIEAPSATKDAFGQQATAADYTVALSTWASINTLTSKEVYALGGSGFTAQVSHKITIRYNPSVTIAAGMRVLYRDRIFTVQIPSDPDEERRELDLICLEVSK